MFAPTSSALSQLSLEPTPGVESLSAGTLLGWLADHLSAADVAFLRGLEDCEIPLSRRNAALIKRAIRSRRPRKGR
jgi:hypothetical protein